VTWVCFMSFFHRDNGTGLGASHQTGWTGTIAFLMDFFGRFDGKRVLETSRELTHPISRGSRLAKKRFAKPGQCRQPSATVEAIHQRRYVHPQAETVRAAVRGHARAEAGHQGWVSINPLSQKVGRVSLGESIRAYGLFRRVRYSAI